MKNVTVNVKVNTYDLVLFTADQKVLEKQMLLPLEITAAKKEVKEKLPEGYKLLNISKGETDTVTYTLPLNEFIEASRRYWATRDEDDRIEA